MNAERRSKDRRNARRAAERSGHGDKYADQPRGAEKEFSDGLAALAEMYTPEWAVGR